MLKKFGILFKALPSQKEFFLPGSISLGELGCYAGEFANKVPQSQILEVHFLLVTDSLTISSSTSVKRTSESYRFLGENLTYENSVESLFKVSLLKLSAFLASLGREIELARDEID